MNLAIWSLARLLGVLLLVSGAVCYVRGLWGVASDKEKDSPENAILSLAGFFMCWLGLLSYIVHLQSGDPNHGNAGLGDGSGSSLGARATFIMLTLAFLLPLVPLYYHALKKWPFPFPKPTGLWRVPTAIILLALSAFVGMTLNISLGSIVYALVGTIPLALAGAWIGASTTDHTWRGFFRIENYLRDQRARHELSQRASKPKQIEPVKPAPPPKLTPRERMQNAVLTKLAEAQTIGEEIGRIRVLATQETDAQMKRIYEDIVGDLETGEWKNWERE